MDQTTGSQVGHEESEPGLHPFKRLHERLHRNRLTGLITKIVVTLIGVGVIVAGLAMLVAPGPGVVAIILGLAILSAEWDWAERWLHRAKEKASAAAERARQVDPAVRRRRTILAALTVAAVAGGVGAYLFFYDWPVWAISGWELVQSLSAWVPELPGM